MANKYKTIMMNHRRFGKSRTMLYLSLASFLRSIGATEDEIRKFFEDMEKENALAHQ